ncbi:Endonuclease/exonuclease/phosphatase [Kockovaella imperatae]|uniref:Endonuclease/exonuclease/phosphatase n=1 Tax=Kockovaella imperatae TaxID=4999 RepID=A0A1Y1UKL6_9TREE|nr:Endonuclease/exonuclease/phosphatase [Kockovaella imperatae]ORX38593.1 Endonuclease/exonuclease/phosphatase [Kockovaella imperatae]
MPGNGVEDDSEPSLSISELKSRFERLSGGQSVSNKGGPTNPGQRIRQGMSGVRPAEGGAEKVIETPSSEASNVADSASQSSSRTQPAKPVKPKPMVPSKTSIVRPSTIPSADLIDFARGDSAQLELSSAGDEPKSARRSALIPPVSKATTQILSAQSSRTVSPVPSPAAATDDSDQKAPSVRLMKEKLVAIDGAGRSEQTNTRDNMRGSTPPGEVVRVGLSDPNPSDSPGGSTQIPPRASPIPPPQPSRSTKPSRPVSPQPLLVSTSSDLLSSSPASLASPLQSISRKPSTTGPTSVSSGPPPIPPNRPSSSTSTDEVAPSASRSTSEDTSTPPRLPSRSRTQTMTKLQANKAPPLPTRAPTLEMPSLQAPRLPPTSKSLPVPSVSSNTGSFNAHSRAMPPTPPSDDYVPPPPPTRSLNPSSQSSIARKPSRRETMTLIDYGASSEEEEEAGPATAMAQSTLAKRAMDELPDTTHANKRAPGFSPDVHLRHPHQINSFAVFGRFVCTGAHHVRVYDTQMSERPIFVVDLRDTGLEFRIKDPKVTAMCFRPTLERMDQGRYLLCGTKDGHLWCLDVMTGEVTDSRSWVHGAAISHIFRHKNWILTLDEMGKMHIYQVTQDDDPSKIPNQVRTARVGDKFTFARVLSGRLWTGGAPATRSTTNASTAKGPTIRVYDPCIEGAMPPPRSAQTTEWCGAVTSGATCPFDPDKVYLGHEGGFISIWSAADVTCQQVLKVSSTDILALEGVGGRLWFGTRKGQINVCNVSEVPWETTNIWTAHFDSPIYHLAFDPWSIENSGRFAVYSTTRDSVRAWDGLLSVEWIDKQMDLRQPEYCTFRDVKALICTWNIDSARPQDLSGSEANSSFFDELFGSIDKPDIIVFGFQEVIPLTDKKLTAKTLLFGNKKDVGASNDKVSVAYRMWTDKFTQVLRMVYPDQQYIKVQSESLVGLLTCVFVKADERNALRDVQICTVKRGIGGIYGNKGAIIARMIMDDTSLCFVNVHLAAGQSAKASRNADIVGIMEERAIFPLSEDGEAGMAFEHGGDGTAILDHEIVVLNGDLNYRIDQRRETVLQSVAANDLSFLLENDQLNKEMRFNRSFRLRTFTEMPINFAPTYKYNPHSQDYDSSEKNRIPAWCDRVLYTSNPRIKALSYRRYEPTVSDHRPVSAGLQFTLKRVDGDLMTEVRRDVGAQWAKKEMEMLQKMADVFASLW